MGTSALPDMYARRLRAEGIHIRQRMSAHVITNICDTSGTLKICIQLDYISSLYLHIYSRILIVIVGFYYDAGIMFCTL